MEFKTAIHSQDDRLQVLEIIGNASKGGMENYLKSFIQNIPDNKINLTCICPYESDFTAALRELGIKDIYIARIEDDPYWRSIQLAVEVSKLKKIDVLHAHMPKAHLLAGLAGSLLQTPVVATIHGMDITAHELGIAKAVNSHLITNNQEAYVQALAMGIPGTQLHIIRNGVDVGKFNKENNGDSFRKMIGVSSTSTLVGFVGRLDYEKGPDQFLKAASIVRNEKPDVHFVMVGEGIMTKVLQKLCQDLKLTDCITFLPWQEANWAIYPALDILAHTSRSDGTSLVLLEAMSCGIPTVAIRVGGVPEIVEHATTGLLSNDWEGVAENILYLLDKPLIMEKMKKAAVKRINTHFNVRTNTEKVVDILENVASENYLGFNLPRVLIKEESKKKVVSGVFSK
ncbi:MAG: glycosyltransferase family 4 protein [Ginsengibacter sp.]